MAAGRSAAEAREAAWPAWLAAGERAEGACWPRLDRRRKDQKTSRWVLGFADGRQDVVRLVAPGGKPIWLTRAGDVLEGLTYWQDLPPAPRITPAAG